MSTKFFAKWLRLIAVVLLLLTTFAASTVQADGPVPAGIISGGVLHSCALRPDGSIDCWGDNTDGAAEDQVGPYIEVGAGRSHSCALTPVGAVDCWGNNSFFQAADQPGPYSRISVGHSFTCALTPSGAADCWGKNTYGESQDQIGPYSQLSAGMFHTCALTPAGAVDCWGYNIHGQADDQAGPYIQVVTGMLYTCALTPTGAVDCWGRSDYGEGQGQPGPYTQITAGSGHTCGLTPSGAVDCWGYNQYGQSTDQPGPYIWVSAGAYHTCALTPAGAVNCWRDNYYGEAGYHPGPYGAYQPVGDTISPVVTVTGVTEGSIYTLGAVPQAGCSTTDEDSGVAVEANLSLSGGNTLGVGTFTATCSGALDNAGNPGNTATVSYSVAFQFPGFTGPVDNPPVMNVARAGQTIPLKWRLTDANGNPITNLTNVSVTASDLACNSGSSSDAIEEYAASNSGLQNLGDGYYQWNWKSPTTYAGSCKTLKLDLGEGVVHTALFQFRN